MTRFSRWLRAIKVGFVMGFITVQKPDVIVEGIPVVITKFLPWLNFEPIPNYPAACFIECRGKITIAVNRACNSASVRIVGALLSHEIGRLVYRMSDPSTTDICANIKEEFEADKYAAEKGYRSEMIEYLTVVLPEIADPKAQYIIRKRIEMLQNQ